MPDRSKAPAVRECEFRPMPEQRTEVLSNGLTLHIYTGGMEPLVSLSVLFAGGRAEASDVSLPELASVIAGEGTASHSGGEIAETLDFCGARLCPRHGDHYRGQSLLMLADKAAMLLPLFSEILTCPSYPAQAVEATKTAIAGRTSVEMAKATYKASRALAEMMYGSGHPLARFASPESIGAVTPDMLRVFQRRAMCPSKAHAFLAGLPDEATIAATRAMLESLAPAGEGFARDRSPLRTCAPGRIDVADKGAAVQSAVEIGIPGLPRSHPDYIPLRLSVMALGGYFGSRLMKNIREEKGYTYGISAALLGSPEGGYVNISAECDPRYTDSLLDETRAELRRLQSEPPTGEELARLKIYASTRLASSLDSPFSIMGYYMTGLTAGYDEGYFAAQQQAIAALSPDIIAEMARKYLDPSKMRVAVC